MNEINERYTRGYRTSYEDRGAVYEYDRSLNSALSSPVTGITSRDDIINPEELINLDMYARTARGKALYEEHLGALRNIQSQQQASYDEWYNSEAQQAIRQREAGLNPNLNGVESSSTQSPDVSQNSPVEGMQTVGDQALSGLSVAASLGSMVASGISACANLASLPASIAANYASAGASAANAAYIASQTDSQTLANLASFEKLASADVASRLANATSAFVNTASNAGQAFDFDAWFNDPKNSEGLIGYAPSDNPIYQAAISRVMKRQQENIGKSYDVYGNRLKGQSSVAQMLASGYYDDNLIIQVGLMEPLYDAYKEHELVMLDFETKFHQLEIAKLDEVDKQLYLQDLEEDLRKRIAENQYYTDYFTNFDGESSALYDLLQKKYDLIDKRSSARIKKNLEDIYNDRPNSYMGQRALSLILGGGHLTFSQYLTALGTEMAEQANVPKFDNPYNGKEFMPSTGSGLGNYFANPFGVPNMRNLQEQMGRFSFTPPGGTYVPTF